MSLLPAAVWQIHVEKGRQIAEMAADRKSEKYANLLPSHIFQPIAMQHLDTFSLSTTETELLIVLGRRLSWQSREDRERSFLSQHSVAIQRFNSALCTTHLPRRSG